MPSIKGRNINVLIWLVPIIFPGLIVAAIWYDKIIPPVASALATIDVTRKPSKSDFLSVYQSP
jgi:hypothetical protein